MADSSFQPGTLPVLPTPLADTCYAFYSDPAFKDRSAPFPTYLKSGGLCTLSQTASTFFTSMENLVDPRDPTGRVISFPQAGAGSLLMDGNIEATNLGYLGSATADLREALFNLIDQVGLAQSSLTDTTAQLDAQLTADKQVGQYYVKGSLRLPKQQAAGSYYDSSNKAQTYSTWGQITFGWNFPVTGGTTTVTFHIFLDCNTWISDYPYSEVLSIVPPLDWSPLLSADLSVVTTLSIAGSEDVMDRAVSMISSQLEAQSGTGAFVYHFNAVGPSKAWTVACPFGVVYKGQQPTVQQIRAALRTEMANSGVGTEASWSARFPGVFAIGRYYLVPLWDATTNLGDRQIYSGMIQPNDAIAKVGNVFPAVSATVLNTEGYFITSPYDLIQLMAFRDPNNDPASQIGLLPTLIPSYQTLARDNYLFAQMDQNSQAFSSALIDSLSVLSGQTPDDADLYQQVTELGITTVLFTVGSIEYAVVSPDTYNAAQEANQS